MTANDIIYQGTRAKYRVAIDQFNQSADTFSVTLLYGMMGKQMTIPKADMLEGADGRWYMQFPTDGMVGFVTAVCQYDVPDTDAQGGIRTKTDRQVLCFVATTPRPQMVCLPATDEDSPVHYERTNDSDLGDYHLLADGNGLMLRTVDGLYLAVRKDIDID